MRLESLKTTEKDIGTRIPWMSSSVVQLYICCMNSPAVIQKNYLIKLDEIFCYLHVLHFLPVALENEYMRHIPIRIRVQTAGKATTSTKLLLYLACLHKNVRLVCQWDTALICTFTLGWELCPNHLE